ncbi:MAG: hypothetical protein DIU69_09420 [Bacillota bacterium]|nr:MAG: hypothetical protein DIU69_09420 [Bacillota bacterium]
MIRKVLRTRMALLVAMVVTAVLVPAVAFAATYLPGEWGQPMQVGTNPIVRAIVRLAGFLVPIFGAYVMVIGLIGLIGAIRDAWQGREVKGVGKILQGGGAPVLIKLGEFVVGMLLIAVPLTGAWVPILDALLNFFQFVLNQTANALRSATR